MCSTRQWIALPCLKQFGESQSCDVRLAELTVVEGGLTPAVLPSYSTEQLAK